VRALAGGAGGKQGGASSSLGGLMPSCGPGRSKTGGSGLEPAAALPKRSMAAGLEETSAARVCL
jgi:hypothetical protein